MLPLEASEKIEALKQYYGITHEGELVVRGIEVRRHDTPRFIKHFQTDLLNILFDCKDTEEVINKGYENALLLVTRSIDKIMIGGDDITQDDLVISKLLGQDIIKYRSLFPHVSAAIQLSNGEDKHPSKGDTIRYIYTNSQHKNPLCRVALIDSTYGYENGKRDYDKEKYKEQQKPSWDILALTWTVYENKINKSTRKWKWLQDLKREREQDINIETMEEQ